MDSATIDLVASVLVLCFTSAVATNALTLPSSMTTTLAGAVVLVAGLLVSLVAPLAGISVLILAIILFFRRNMQQTIQGTLRKFEAERAYPPTPAIYGESTIPLAPQDPQTPGYEPTPSGLARGGPRDYTKDLGSLLEGFTPATIEQSEELTPPKGQYRTDESRETASPVVDQYTYRPSPDTGSNEFHRFGPQMDKKVDSFRYYA